MLESHYSHVKRSQQYKYCPPSRGPVLYEHFACLIFLEAEWGECHIEEHFMGLSDLEPWICVTLCDKMCEYKEFMAKMIMGYPIICDEFAWDQETTRHGPSFACSRSNFMSEVRTQSEQNVRLHDLLGKKRERETPFLEGEAGSWRLIWMSGMNLKSWFGGSWIQVIKSSHICSHMFFSRFTTYDNMISKYRYWTV